MSSIIRLLISTFILSNFLFSQIKIACIGNSITYGVLLTDPSTESYPAQLQQLLGSGYDVRNFGWGNATLLQGFPNSYIDCPRFNPSKSEHWDIIIICLGTNDTKDEYHSAIDDFVDDYKDLISRYDNFPGLDAPHCIIGIPPPIHETYSGHSNDYLVDEIKPKLDKVARDMNSRKANFYNVLQDPSYFTDGLHPTKEGAAIMAQVAKSAIELTLNPPPADTEAPTTPSNFSATGLDNKVQLNWNANNESDLYAYQLFKGTVLYGWMNLLATLDKNTTSYSDIDVTNGNTYYYQLCAVDNSNNASSRTSPISATPHNPDTTPPAIPSNFSASVSAGNVSLSWDANSETDLESYNIYRGIAIDGFMNFLVNIDNTKTSYTDYSIDPNTDYYYQMDAKDNSGNLSNRTDKISATTLSISSDESADGVKLYQNTPNPFNPTTRIDYYLPTETVVKINVYDILGNEVKCLCNNYQNSGYHYVYWDGRNSHGETSVDGVYIFSIDAGKFHQTKKMVLIK